MSDYTVFARHKVRNGSTLGVTIRFVASRQVALREFEERYPEYRAEIVNHLYT